MADMPILANLTGNQHVHEGGHNWPDLFVVVDPDQTEVIHDQNYLIDIGRRGRPVIKRLQQDGNWIAVHPALASFTEPTKKDAAGINIMGKIIPIIGGMEFSGRYHCRHIQIHGRIIGFWATLSDSL